MHRIFNCTSDWKAFHEALQRCEDMWEANQYPKEWRATIVNDTITKLLDSSDPKGEGVIMSNTIMSKVIMSKTRVIMSNFFRHNDLYNYVEIF